MDSLDFPSLEARSQNIKDALTRTCSWILQLPEYRQWSGSGDATEESKSRFLWMKGKPACGKSTIMKYVYDSLRTTRKECTVIAFFFNARGEALERSTLGLYRSLLLQLLRRMPALQSVLDDIRLPRNKADELEWQLPMLQRTLKAAVLQANDGKIIFMIDALDECGGPDVQEMISYFHDDLADDESLSPSRFSVFFSSRHYPHVHVRAGVEIVLENQENHTKDIWRYINAKLHLNRSKVANKFKDDILQRSAGVFLWVVLVIKILNDEDARGNVHRLTKRLEGLPTELEKLFEDILSTDTGADPRLLLCVQWILFTFRPLTVPELYWAVLAGTELDSFSDEDLEYARLLERSDMDKFVLSSSRGLIEETKGKQAKVQFIHESVREFFLHRSLESYGFERLGSDPGKSHECLKISCYRYFMHYQKRKESIGTPVNGSSEESPSSLDGTRVKASARPQSSGPWTTYTFLDYTVRFILHHSDLAQGAGIQQGEFVEDLDLAGLLSLRGLLQPRPKKKIPIDVGSRAFAACGLSHLLRMELQRTQNLDKKDAWDVSVFEEAIGAGNHECVSVILELCSPSHYGNMFDGQVRQMGEAERARIVQTLMELRRYPRHATALVKGHLVEPANFDLLRGTTRSRQHTPLSAAVCVGAENVVRWLLSRRVVDINKVGPLGITPLGYAVKARNRAIVKVLLAREDVNISVGEERYRSEPSPLEFACGLLKLVPEMWHLVLDRGFLRPQDRYDMMQVVMQHGDAELIQQTLSSIIQSRCDQFEAYGRQKGLDITIYDDNGVLLRAFLDHKEASNFIDEDEEKRLLRLAAERSSIMTFSVLLDFLVRRGRNVGELCEHALLHTRATKQSSARHQPYCEVQSPKGPCTDALRLDQNGCTPLYHALDIGLTETAKLLLDLRSLSPGLSLTVEEMALKGYYPKLDEVELRTCLLRRILNEEIHSEPEARRLQKRAILSMRSAKDCCDLFSGLKPNWNEPALVGGNGCHLYALLDEAEQAELARFLLIHCCNESSCENSLDRALQIAIQEGEKYVARVLICKDLASINKHEDTGCVPLVLATKGDQTEIMEALLTRSDVDVHARDRTGDTALSKALMLESVSHLHTLLASGRFQEDDFTQDQLEILHDSTMIRYMKMHVKKGWLSKTWPTKQSHPRTILSMEQFFQLVERSGPTGHVT